MCDALMPTSTQVGLSKSNGNHRASLYATTLPAPEDTKNHILANIEENIVFDQDFRRASGETDRVSGSARLGPRTRVDI